MKKDIQFILKSYLFWRLGTILIALIAIIFVPLFGENFFGGKLVNYLNEPLFWGWANFDGEHFTSIALYGYKNLQQFYFPLYPTLVRFLALLFGQTLSSYVLSGIIISNLSIFIALIGLYKLARIDFSEKISKLAILLILFFPTSFFFGAVYSESIFLCLAVWSFYLVRRNKILLATILAMFLSITRVIGIVILPVFLMSKKFFSIILIPLGLLSYFYYLFLNWGGTSKLYQSYTLFGEQRSDHIVLFPQVFYRYLVKIIPNLNWDYFPVVFRVFLEFSVAFLFLYLLIISLGKIRWDYWLFSVLSYLIPTLSGSFSSMPRYVILIFPMFFTLAQILENKNKFVKISTLIVFAILLSIAETLFFRGYFVS